MSTHPPPLSSSNRPPARLVLEDGSIFYGHGFGATDSASVLGEVCFNTSLSGYQEVLTDPSYAGQIVAMTYPLIGNYGVNRRDLESDRIQVKGFVVRELSNRVSNYRSEQRLEDWLAEQGVPGIAGIDTRALTRILRLGGAKKGLISLDPAADDQSLVESAAAAPGLVGQNLVKTVTREQPMTWNTDLEDWTHAGIADDKRSEGPHVVALDCGTKLNILRNLTQAGCRVTVLPFDATPEQIREHDPDGLFVSNGPGDPAAVQPTIDHLRQLMGQLPIFGICLGHQLLALAAGAETFKLKFGHRGANQPVQNLANGKVEITSQNHGFAVDPESLDRLGAEATHINLNDKTLEGFRHRTHPVFAVQYHPESSPGPHDSRYLFESFREMIETGRSPDADRLQDKSLNSA